MRLAPGLALVFCLACGNKEQAPPPVPEIAKAPTGAHGGPEGHEMAMPAGHPPAATPPAGHPPMAAPQAAPPGPPRDVTPSGETRPETLDELTWKVPVEWESRPPASPMRKAELILPGPGGDAELVLYRFPGGAGSVEANLTRWRGQMQGGTDETTEKLEVGKLSVTVLSVSGTYAGGMGPQGPDATKKESSRMIAAVAEGSGDAVFFKTVGPKATVDLWAEPLTAGLKSLTVAGS